MNENLKKGLLIVAIIAATGLFFYQAVNYASGDKMIVVGRIQMPPGFKSEKQQALDAKSKGQSSGERDLGGTLVPPAK
jgi:hypothetical protein